MRCLLRPFATKSARSCAMVRLLKLLPLKRPNKAGLFPVFGKLLARGAGRRSTTVKRLIVKTWSGEQDGGAEGNRQRRIIRRQNINPKTCVMLTKTYNQCDSLPISRQRTPQPATKSRSERAQYKCKIPDPMS